MIRKTRCTNPNKVSVRFELPAAIWADSVSLVGDFNNWNQVSHPLIHDRHDGTWYIVLELERGKEYQFRYLVNGREWHNDWHADKYVPNPYGGTNSVVCSDLPESPDAARRVVEDSGTAAQSEEGTKPSQ